MIVVHTIRKVREIVGKAKGKGKIIGFVPTMGALHDGHLSLVRAARKGTDFVVVSVFVNPKQFAPDGDFKAYPRDFHKDRLILNKQGVDLIFYPSYKSMYPGKFSTYVEDIALSRHLCGARRPAHFRGVCTVVTKLFNIVQPDISYFGRKDYQQAQIIKILGQDLNFPIKVVTLPIVREKDGLAMSSRNRYLNNRQRKQALCLYKSLRLACKLIKKGQTNPKQVIKNMKAFIAGYAPYAEIDYINIVNTRTLEDVKIIRGRVLVALAVYLAKVRLIDNVIIDRRPKTEDRRPKTEDRRPKTN